MPEKHKPGRGDKRPSVGRPLVDEFGSIAPLEPEVVAAPLVDEFGHVGLMSRVQFSPEKRQSEVGRLTMLFGERGWEGDSKYFNRLIDNGWTAGRITGKDQLVAAHEWYKNQYGVTLELELKPLKPRRFNFLPRLPNGCNLSLICPLI